MGPTLTGNPMQATTMIIRSRIAPTPSGFLHLGNGVNFVITWLLTRQAGGRLRLRIDDADCSRSRPEYLDDIFHQLEWLGITWDEGPSGPDDFSRHHSQQLRLGRYRSVLSELATRGHVYPCTCSRSRIKQLAAGPVYPGFCRQHRGTTPAGPHALRLLVDQAATIHLHGQPISPAASMGDFVLWRRDDLPAYQLASLVDDMDHGINLIVRGNDLIVSTAAQLLLADCLGADGFKTIIFHHHPLIADPKGAKLSKSDDALSLAAMRQAGARPALVYQQAARLLGLDLPAVDSLDELLAQTSRRAA